MYQFSDPTPPTGYSTIWSDIVVIQSPLIVYPATTHMPILYAPAPCSCRGIGWVVCQVGLVFARIRICSCWSGMWVFTGVFVIRWVICVRFSIGCWGLALGLICCWCWVVSICSNFYESWSAQLTLPSDPEYWNYWLSLHSYHTISHPHQSNPTYTSPSPLHSHTHNPHNPHHPCICSLAAYSRRDSNWEYNL